MAVDPFVDSTPANPLLSIHLIDISATTKYETRYMLTSSTCAPLTESGHSILIWTVGPGSRGSLSSTYLPGCQVPRPSLFKPVILPESMQSTWPRDTLSNNMASQFVNDILNVFKLRIRPVGSFNLPHPSPPPSGRCDRNGRHTRSSPSRPFNST